MTLTSAAIKIEAEIGREESSLFLATHGHDVGVSPVEAERWAWVREMRTRHRTLRRLVAYAERTGGPIATDMLNIATQLWDWRQS